MPRGSRKTEAWGGEGSGQHHPATGKEPGPPLPWSWCQHLPQLHTGPTPAHARALFRAKAEQAAQETSEPAPCRLSPYFSS